MLAGSPAFQFYASDWAHSVSSLTLEERGAYITLLAWSWEHGPIENDLRRIAVLLGVTVSHARRLWERISKKWELCADGLWIQPRLEHVRAEAAAFSALQSQKGKASAYARRKPTKEATAVQPRLAPRHQPDTQPNGQPDTQPGGNSPISDLRSPEDPRPSRDHSVSDLPRARDPVVDSDGRFLNQGGAWKPVAMRPSTALMSGAEARRHGVHAWCCDRGLCVPWGLHADFLARLGGEHGDTRLRTWYAETIARFVNQSVGDDLFVFWRNEFASWVGTVTERPRARGQDTRGSRAIEAFDRAGEALERHHARRSE